MTEPFQLSQDSASDSMYEKLGLKPFLFDDNPCILCDAVPRFLRQGQGA